MKLYYAGASCSLACQIVLSETKTIYEAIKVDLRSKTTATGENYWTINEKGYVPALVLDSGELLTEIPAILQYLADKTPAANLAPHAGSWERYRLIEWLNYIATEVHKGFSALWNPLAVEEYKSIVIENLHKRFDFLEKDLSRHTYLLGDSFSIADAYLFVVLNWAHLLKMDLSSWPKMNDYMERIRQRPSVQAAMDTAGIKMKDLKTA